MKTPTVTTKVYCGTLIRRVTIVTLLSPTPDIQEARSGVAIMAHYVILRFRHLPDFIRYLHLGTFDLVYMLMNQCPDFQRRKNETLNLLLLYDIRKSSSFRTESVLFRSTCLFVDTRETRDTDDTRACAPKVTSRSDKGVDKLLLTRLISLTRKVDSQSGHFCRSCSIGSSPSVLKSKLCTILDLGRTPRRELGMRSRLWAVMGADCWRCIIGGTRSASWLSFPETSLSHAYNHHQPQKAYRRYTNSDSVGIICHCLELLRLLSRTSDILTSVPDVVRDRRTAVPISLRMAWRDCWTK